MLALFPVNENIGNGTGIGTLIPTWPQSMLAVKWRAAAPD